MASSVPVERIEEVDAPAEPEYLEDVTDHEAVRNTSPVPASPPHTVAQRFIGWLKAGLGAGTLRVNEPGALVHGVEEGLLLVSPRIFREFAKRLARDSHVEGMPEVGAETAKWVQRQVLRAGWHLQAAGGINILTYQVVRADRAVARLSGVVIADPARLIGAAPARNPMLVRAPAAHGLSA